MLIWMIKHKIVTKTINVDAFLVKAQGACVRESLKTDDNHTV